MNYDDLSPEELKAELQKLHNTQQLSEDMDAVNEQLFRFFGIIISSSF